MSSYWPVQIDYPTFSRRLEYDRLGRVIRELDDLGSETHSRKYTYDDAGNVLTVTDEENNTTRFEYDVFNRLVKTTDALGGEVVNAYDFMGNLVQVQDTNNGNTFFHYDKNSWLIKIVRPMLEETTYEYDGNGNRTAVIDSKGQRIEYEYNAIDRLTRVRYFEAGNWNTPVKSVDFDYDDLGNLTAYDDGTTSAVYEYDDLQQKTSETVNYGAFSLNYTYAYTDNGLKKTFTGPDGTAIEYAYDENNRLVGIAVPGQGQVNYQYDTAHWNSPFGRTLPGGGGTEYDYDPLMRLAAMTSMDPGRNTLMSREYDYSPAGNITDKFTEHGDYAYNYDELHRLVGALNPTLPDEEYTYDAMGNRLTSSATSGDWKYNADNQLMNYDTTTFDYDANGNMTRKTVDGVTRYFVYDIEDRMIRVEDGDHVAIAEYYYDPFGRRLWKDVSGTRTNFLYSDEGLIGEYDVTGSEIKTFGWLPDSVWGTNPLFLKQNGSYYWYHNDSAGTPQRMVRANGSTVWAATYDSFGNAQVSIEQIANPFRFSGQYFDAETGLHYNLNRYYDPAIGRYMRVDPVGDGLNLYAYCYNNPTGFVDPMGLCAASGALSGVHNALAVAGLIPGLGIIPDLLDGLLYLYEGDYSNAAMSGVAAVPLLGQFARAAWFANKAAKMANAYDLAKTAARYGDEAADAMRRASPPCFVAGTLVQTSEGLKPIEEIEPDDYVLSRDEQTGEMEYKRVVRAFVTPDQAVIELNLEGENGNTETIGATAEHPFWVKARGWVGAGELLPGDEVFTSTGGWLKVTGSTWLSGRQTVYNLEVEGFHTYFVGDVGVWVHNMCAMEASKSVVEQPRDALGRFMSKTGDEVIPGSVAEQGVWDAIKQKPGWQVVEGRVSVRDASGQLRVYDGVAVSPSGKTIGLEVKSGTATKTAAQRAFDSTLNSSRANTATGVGQSQGIVVNRSIQIRR